MESSAAGFYSSKHEVYKSKLREASKKIRLFAWYRLFAFILVFIPVSVIAGVHNIILSVIVVPVGFASSENVSGSPSGSVAWSVSLYCIPIQAVSRMAPTNCGAWFILRKMITESLPVFPNES